MKQYVCRITVEAVKISTAVKNEAGDWTVLGENELHNIPSDQAKGFKFNKKDPGYLIRYGNGVVEHMTSARFNKLYGECVNGTYDGVFDASAANADEAPHNDDNTTAKNRRAYEASVKRSATVVPIANEPIENRGFDNGDVAQFVNRQPAPIQQQPMQQPMQQPPRVLRPAPAQPEKRGFMDRIQRPERINSDLVLTLLFIVSCGLFTAL